MWPINLRESSRLMIDSLKYSLRAACSCCNLNEISDLPPSNYASVLDFENAGRRGCAKCSITLEAVLAYSDQWKGVASSEVKIRPPRHARGFGNGTIRISVLWPDKPAGWATPFQLHMYFPEGSNPLFPFTRPKDCVPLWSGSEVCFDKISSWITECSGTHSMCNFVDECTFFPTRLVDTSPGDSDDGVRLVTSDKIERSSARYAALSHSWGLKTQRVKAIPKTTKQSIKDRLRQIPFEDLTKTFQDAVIMARQLGIKYIWIDSLCIIQDDADDFVTQVEQMAKIYGGAYLVISALRAATGDVGIFHSRPRVLRITHKDGWGSSITACVRPEIRHEDFTTAEPRNFATSPLFARAWCFQERLLARRLVHFWEHEIVWECNKTLYCECDGMYDIWETDGNFRRRQALSLQKADIEVRMKTWYDVIRAYTSRSLTVENDRLPALSGFAQRVTMPELGRYCAGLWESQLPTALLWQPLRPLPESGGLIKRPDSYQAPSWSWPSVQAVIEAYVKYDKRSEVVARVLEVVCNPLTSDTFGQVSYGHIVLNAPVVEVVLRTGGEGIPVYGDSRIRAQSCAYRLEKDNDSYAFQADVGLDEGCPDHVPLGDIVLCVVVECHLEHLYPSRGRCLVLRRELSDLSMSEQWHRIGTFNIPGLWRRDASRRELKIL